MIVDFHAHVYPDWIQKDKEKYLEKDQTFKDLFSDPKSKMADVDKLIKDMDEDGVDISVIMGIGWTDTGLAREMNDYIIESVAKYPDRLVGFAGVNPSWGGTAVREADRCAKAGLQGLGEFHPDTQGFDIGDLKVMSPLAEVVQDQDLIISTHTSEPVGHSYKGKGKTTPFFLWEFIKNFPEIPIICAHWGGGLPFYALMPEVLESLKSVYFDTSASPFLYSNRIYPVVASLVGIGGILMGSDYPLLSARRVLKDIEDSMVLNEDQKTAITGGNAVKLLGINVEGK